MNASEKFIKVAKSVLPSPFTIAVILTFITYFLALFITNSEPENLTAYPIQLLEFWNKGFWELLQFAMQMTLMLLLGHVLAISKPVSSFINRLVSTIDNSAKAALYTALFTVSVSLFNWGLGLIFGAIFARKIAEHATAKNIEINYPLIGAAGYTGLMVWHGGLSGSAPLKAAEEGHFLLNQIGIIDIGQTIFSPMNIVASILIIILLPLTAYLVAKKSSTKKVEVHNLKTIHLEEKPEGAERIDHLKLPAYILGGIIFIFCIYIGFSTYKQAGLRFVNPNFINFLLLGLGILFHGTIHSFLNATEEAVKGTTGIIIQFPLYAGIMGIMKYSGLVGVFSEFFVQISNETTFPLFTFISAGIVNVFVPSGGGQWAVQGPIIAQACSELNLPIGKSIMALAYGDQLTNMMQPFWALPLLGITGLKAKDILPYTLLFMGVGIFVYGLVLLLF